VREEQVALQTFDPRVVARFPLQIEFGSLNEILRVNLDPGMIQTRVIGDKIEHQSQAALTEPLAQTEQGRISAKLLMNCIACDGETGTRYVFLPKVRQSLPEFFAPLLVLTGNTLCRRAGLPDAQEPEPVEAHLGEAIKLRVRNVVQRGSPAETLGKFGQPD